MRVLIVVHGYPPRHNGGAERRAQRTATALAGRGHQVQVLAVDTPITPSRAVSVESSHEHGVDVRRVSGILQGNDPLAVADDNPRVVAEIEALLARSRFDVIHQFSGYLTSAGVVRVARRHRIPSVVSLTDYWWLCHRITLVTPRGELCDGPSPTGCAQCEGEVRRRWRWLGHLAPRASRLVWAGQLALATAELSPKLSYQQHRVEELLDTLNGASTLISPSTFVAEMHSRHGVAPERVRVSRQGVSLSVCPIRLPSAALRVGYLGQVKRHKGVDVLLDAWSLVAGDAPRQLTIYGSDAGEPEFGRSVRTRLLALPDATWSGSVEPGKLWDALAQLDVVVVPSRWAENSPNVILEAQAMGVPVVGSRIGGIPELVRHNENGLLVEPDSPPALAEALQHLLDHADVRRRLSQGALPFRTLEDEIDDVIAVYRSTCAA